MYILIISLIGLGCSSQFVEDDRKMTYDQEAENNQIKNQEQTSTTTQEAEEMVQNDKEVSKDQPSNSNYNQDKRPIKSEQTIPENTARVDDDGNLIVTNLLDPLILVNKSRFLTSDYIPPDLVEPYVPFSFEEKLSKRLMREEAARALEKLFAKALEDGIELLGQSAYRSYETQEAIFAYNTRHLGEEEANRISAYPGQSEHQSGLAIDVTSRSVGLGLDESFGETPEGIWLKENAAEYGFIIRYLKDKEKITGYVYEPWHIRYVGIVAAKKIYENDLTLEEYIEHFLIERSMLIDKSYGTTLHYFEEN